MLLNIERVYTYINYLLEFDIDSYYGIITRKIICLIKFRKNIWHIVIIIEIGQTMLFQGFLCSVYHTLRMLNITRLRIDRPLVCCCYPYIMDTPLR